MSQEAFKEWLRSEIGGKVTQGVFDLILAIPLIGFSYGWISEPYFGEFWWAEYRAWLVLFGLELVAGALLALLVHWLWCFPIAFSSGLVFLYFYQKECDSFADCNLAAFLAYGTTIIFLIPVLVGGGVLIVRKVLS